MNLMVEKKKMIAYKIPFYRHDLGEAELESLRKVINGPILTSGETTLEFERKFSNYLGSKNCYAVNSCTAALHLSLLAYGVAPGDEVITVALTFSATVLPIIHVGAIPVFVDVDLETGLIDTSLIERVITSKTRAIIVVHLYGLMVDMLEIQRIAKLYNLKIIEDCAHALESSRDGVRPGQLSNSACFSFFATKNITCGEGGALTTNDDELDSLIKQLRLHGLTKTAFDRAKEGYKEYDVFVPGWKYNMSNIEASILLPQLERLSKNSYKRKKLYDLYQDKIRSNCNVRTLLNSAELSQLKIVNAMHLFPIFVDPNKRDGLMEHLGKNGIETTVNYKPLHKFKLFSNFIREKLPNTDFLGMGEISLPFYPNMPSEHVDIIVDSINEYFEEKNDNNFGATA